VTGAPARVLVLSSTFPQFPGDPRGRFILRHWERRAEAGQHVRFLVPDTRWVRDGLTSPCEVVRFHYAPQPLASLTGHFGILENIRDRPWRALLVLPFLAGLHRALQAELQRFRPDRIVAHMLLPCGLVAALAARAAGLACELHGHGTDVDLVLALPGPLRRRVARALLAADRLTFPSAEKLARFARALDLDSVPAHCQVETMLATTEPHHDIPLTTPSSRDVLFLGRLIKQKGVDDLLTAAALMSEPPRLEIAGDGPERRRLQAMARAHRLDAHFHGFVHGPQKDALYRRAALLCVPSREIGGLGEGAPLVIAEARRYGLRVVATAVGGIPELMRDLYPGAPLVRPGAPEALARALSSALVPMSAH
jgi:glycosyltransferase involved in cell wall biosynthesis